ncbi:MAG: hypothetical protein RBT76_06360 [candidate division Zixibacteria bacterium]|jgi:negative regulator of sigma E activity|nr:hypothetical protein [candidate division Zixibacteria bacterium]
MRFQKVRSFLSAYSNDELTDRQREAVRERLAKDSHLRAEEQAFRAMRDASRDIPPLKVSDDFNSRLLNRIAHERFAETRSNAMLPRKRVPAPLWWKAVPVAVTAVLLLAAVMLTGDFNQFGSPSATNSGAGSLDDAYLTVQPVDNPNLAVSVGTGWSLERELQRSQQVTQIFSALTARNGFVSLDRLAGQVQNVSARQSGFSPYLTDYYRFRPVLRVYRVSDVREDGSVY